jgi:protein-S-isoprenylcysteine O-methyltransferase Ste14
MLGKIYNLLKPILRFTPLELILSTILALWLLYILSNNLSEFSIPFIIFLSLLVVTGGSICFAHMEPIAGNASKPGKLITTGGLRKRIRYPQKFGYLLSELSFTILVFNPFALLLFTFIFWMNVEIARAQDEVLAREYPEQFEAWRKHTRLLIPGIL